ncbi:MAG: heme o synthase [Anaerolineae bacterium]
MVPLDLESPAGSVRRRIRKLAAYASLCKPRVVAMLVFTAEVGYVLGAQGQVEWSQLILLALGGGLAAAGAAALNQYLDRHLDALMARTAGRPLPSGAIENPSLAALLGIILILSGLAFSLAISPAVALIVALGAGIYLLVYTLWLKRRHPLNVVIGGAAGCCPILAGWLTGAPQLDATAWLLAGVVFAWTPPHFWSLVLVNRDDYRLAGIPMLPSRVHERAAAGYILLGTVLTVVLSLILPATMGLSGVGLSVILFAAAIFFASGVLLLLQPKEATAWRHYKLANLFLATIFTVVLLDAAL